MIPLLLGVAFAAGIHAGIPVRGVEGLGEPTFLTPTTGWTAAVDGGWVRVFVGRDEAEAADWYIHQLETFGVTPPPYALASVDEAHGDGTSLLTFREGNVGVVARTDLGVRGVVERLRAAIVGSAPALVANLRSPYLDEGGVWVEAPGAAAVKAANGAIIRRTPVHFERRPAEVYVWDAWGRVTVLR